MKRILLFTGGALLIATMLLLGCKKDNEVNPTINKYFSVENATLIKQNMPEPTSTNEIAVSMNGNVIPGGSSVVSIQTEKAAKKILVGMKDQAGYYEFGPSTRGEYSFVMMVNQDIKLDDDATSFTVQVAIEDEDGAISKIWESNVSLLVVGTGALQVSLSFDNEKDVDLHLIEPEYSYEGEEVSFYDRHIYFSNTTAAYSGGDLDLDSNPGCYIDYINNENITYSEESFVPAGTYKVYVDLYENCNPSIATNYVVTVFYGGSLIAKRSGIFEIGAESTFNPITQDYVANHDPFLSFTIADKGQKSMKYYGRAPMTESAIEKEANSLNK